MKKIKNKKKFKVIDFNKQILWAILSLFVVVGGAIGINSINTVKAENVPAHEKTIRDNHDGTYTLSLNVTGESEPSEEPTSKANVIIVLDKSGSMAEPVSTAGATQNNRGKYCRTSRTSGGVTTYTYYQTYYRTGNQWSGYTYHLVGNNDDHSTVYYQTATVTSTSWNDCSNGNRYNFTNNDSRYDQTKTAVKNAVSTLLSQNSTKNTDVVEVALMTFSTTSQFVTPSSATATGWISGSNTTSIDNAVDSIQPVGGTNWDMALYNAISLASAKKTAQPDEEVYVIFFSDGEPTLHNGDASSATSHSHSTSGNPSGGGNYTDDADKYAAYYEGKRMYNNYHLYGILAYGSGDTYMKELVSYANYNDVTHANPAAGSSIEPVEGNTYFPASDQESINNAFNSIVTSIINQIGFSGVSVSDGTTAAKTATSGTGAPGSLLKVDTSSYKYYLSFPLKANGTSDSQYITEITKITDTDTCKNCYALKSLNGNTYNVSRVTAYERDPNTGAETTTERPDVFKFEWKPNVDNPLHQENPPVASYNTSTNSVDWDLSTLNEPVLLNDITYTVTFDVYPGQVTLDIMADVKNGKIKLDGTETNHTVVADGAGYVLIEDYIRCNTETKECALKTNTNASLTYTDTRTDDGEQTIPFVNPDPVSASTVKTFAIAKKWENFGSTTGEPEITLNVDRDDSQKHYTVTLGNSNNWLKEVYASIGIMTVKDGHVTVKAGAEGHDYAFSEEQEISYKWELTSPVIRPMMVNGATTTLIKVEKPANMSGEVYEETPTEETPDTYYVNENGKNVYYKLGENEYYVVGKGSATLTATNSRRSHLDLTKNVTGEDAPEDAYFSFNIKVDEGKAEDVYFALQNENEEYMINDETMTYFSGEGVSREIKELNPDKDKNITDITPNYENGEIVSISYKYKGTSFTVEYAGKTDDNKYYKYYTDYYFMASGKTVTVKMKANWNLRFTNLSSDTDYEITESTTVVDSEGNTIAGFRFTSTLDQDDNEGNNVKYEGTIDTPNKEFSVTYNNEYILRHVDVTKSWSDSENQDGIRPSSVEVVLTGKDPSDNNSTTTYKITLDGTQDKENGVVVTHGETAAWKATFNDLPVYGKDGKTKIIYDANETNTSVINGTDGVGTYAYIVTGSADDGFTITNVHTPEKTSVTVTKAWSDNNNQDNIRPSSVSVALYIGETKQGDSVTLNEGNNWTYTWSNLDKYAGTTTPIAYTVKEDTTSVITGTNKAGEYAIAVTGSIAEGFTVTNTHTPEKTSVSVNKVWSDNNDQDGFRPTSVSVGLYIGETKQGDSVTLNAGNNWAYTWSNLDKYNHSSTPIEYTVKEDRTTVISGTNGPGTYAITETKNADGSFTVTNTHTPEKTSVSATKAWSDNNNQDAIRPSSVSVALYIGDEKQGDSVTLNAGNNWTTTWSNLDKYAGGEEIAYTVKEDTTSVITGTNKAGEYAIAVTGSIAEGFTVTNTHTPEKTSVTVTKSWNDANNQDGIRPSSVSVGLYIGETKQGDSVTLNAGNNWTYTWSDLAKYAGTTTPIAYTVKEDTTDVITGTDGVGTYSQAVTGSIAEGFTVTNKHTPEKTSVKVTKVWDDNGNVDKLRPANVTVGLYIGEELQGQKVTLNEGNNWTYTWNNLDKYAGTTTPIAYTVKEDTIPGYISEKTTTNDGFSIKNALDPTAITVTKVWNDNGNQDNIRPASVKVNLIATTETTSKKLRDAELNASNEWKASFTNLPKYMDGEEITYSITEDTTSVITLSTDGPGTYSQAITKNTDGTFTVTNTHTPEKTSVSVNKVWSDNNDQDGFRPTSVSVGLYIGETKQGDSVTLNAGNDWTYTWSNLDKYDHSSTPIEYTVKEDKTEVITGTNGAGTYAITETKKEDGSFTVTNTHTPEKTSVSATKSWSDANNQDAIRPSSVSVALYIGEEKQGDSVTLNDDNEWTTTWSNLDKYAGGEEIAYTVKEDTTDVITGTDKAGEYAIAVTGSIAEGFTVTNTHTPEVRDITVTKSWSDANNQDGIRPSSVSVGLYIGETKQGDSVTLNDDNNWTYTWKGLAKYAGSTTEIAYTVKEDTTSVITGTDKAGEYAIAVTGNMTSGYTITNTHTPEVRDITATKTWDDANNQDGKRPDKITINLLADGKTIDSQTVTAKENWSYKWEKLDKYAGGKEISYTITEDTVTGYTTTVSGFNITNKYTPEKTSVMVTKSWNDGDDQDGIRPDYVTVNLMVGDKEIDEATLTEVDGWTYTFTELPKYEGGKEIDYTVTEDEVSGYTTKITGTIASGYTVTNTHVTEVTSVSGTKVWADNDNQDGKRPSSITIRLLANGKEVAHKEVTANDGWKFTFDNIPKNAGGSAITYTITEDTTSVITGIDGPGTYTQAITGNMKDGFKVTNTHTPELTSVSGKKAWVDSENNDNLRPTEITVNLLANKNKVKSTTVTAGDNGNWEYSFTGLPKYEGGKEIDYTVDEEKVPGYELSHDESNRYILVNTHNLNQKEITVNKVWDDEDNIDGLRPSEIQVQLIGKVGEKVVVEKETETIKADKEGKWTYTWTELNEFYQGSEIVYSVKEITDVKEYSVAYTNKDNVYTITNTHKHATVDVTGTKTWNDADDNDGLRPESITINLLANGEKTDERTVSEADEWTYSFTELPKYIDGKEVEYTIEEVSVEGYTSVVEDYDITNTHTPETVSFSITKVWVDADDSAGLRPESITVSVKVKGEVVASKEITAEDGWKYTFDGLLKYENGELIDYEIVEDVVNGYSSEITNEENEYTVTNTAVVDITINKTWDDMNDISEIRPDHITVNLFADGKQIQTIVITEEDDWTKTITNLPKYNEDDEEIVYTITEDEVFEYETIIDGFNITNKYEPGKGNGEDPEITPPQTGVEMPNTHTNILYIVFMILSILNLNIGILKNS